MGGDGGTLNNTRAEHASIRRSALVQRRDPTVRASVRECTLSHVELLPPEVVVDVAGQLYNKSAILENLLNRGAGASHIKKMSRDVAKVQFERDVTGAPLCAVTRAVVRADGTFSVGWLCGCITAIIPGANVGDDCPACGEPGNRVTLGLTVAERTRIIDKVIIERKERREKKRRKESVVVENVKKTRAGDLTKTVVQKE